MGKIGNLFANLNLNTAGFSSGLDRSGKKAASFRSRLGAGFKQMGKIVAVATAAVAAGAAKLVASTLQANDVLAKMAQSTGISVESLSGFGFAAEQSGINLEMLSQRMVNLARRAKEGDRGVKSYRLAFDTLGISLRNSAGKLKGTENLLLEVAEAFSKMEDGTMKTALATDIFSNAGVKMIPFLNQGKAGIQGLVKEAKIYGRVVSTEAAQASEVFNDNLNKMKSALTGVGNAIVEETIPAMNDLTETTVGWIRESNVIQDTAKTISLSFKLIVSAGKIVVGVFETLSIKLQTLTTVATLVLRRDFAGALEAIRIGQTELASNTQKTIASVEETWRNLPTNLEPPVTKAKDKIGSIGEKAKESFEVGLRAARDFAKEMDRIFKEDIAAFEPGKGLEERRRRKFQENLGLGDLKLDLKSLGPLFVGNKKLAEALSTSYGTLAQVGEVLSDTSKELGQQIGDGFADAIIQGKGFGNVLKSLFTDLGKLLVRASFMKALGGIFGGVFGGGGLKLKGFAHGGRPPVGRPSLVGEGGVAEVFVPDTAGTILPLGSGFGSVVVQIDARGAAPGVEHRLMRVIRQMGNVAVARAVFAIRDNALRGG